VVRRRLPAVEVVAAADQLERQESGSIVGPLWLRDGDPEAQGDFPEVGWLDAPVILLASWISEMQRVARAVPSARAEGACHFGDGPYYFTITVGTGGAWHVRCFEAREQQEGADVPIHEWRTGGAAFLASAIRAARAVLAQCDEHGWWSRDTERLRRCLEARSGFHTS
jgi:hypothetical protein